MTTTTDDLAAAAVAYLRTYAANMREAHAAAPRNDEGRASLFHKAGLAEALEIDLLASAELLDVVAEGLANHLVTLALELPSMKRRHLCPFCQGARDCAHCNSTGDAPCVGDNCPRCGV